MNKILINIFSCVFISPWKGQTFNYKTGLQRKMKLFNFILLSLSLFSSSCEKIFGEPDPEKLTFPLIAYSGSELKIKDSRYLCVLFVRLPGGFKVSSL